MRLTDIQERARDLGLGTQMKRGELWVQQFSDIDKLLQVQNECSQSEFRTRFLGENDFRLAPEETILGVY